jgi:hypothetical protein
VCREDVMGGDALIREDDTGADEITCEGVFN